MNIKKCLKSPFEDENPVFCDPLAEKKEEFEVLFNSYSQGREDKFNLYRTMCFRLFASEYYFMRKGCLDKLCETELNALLEEIKRMTELKNKF